MPAHAPDRRRVVGTLGTLGVLGVTGGLGALLSSCTSDGSGDEATPTGPPPPDPRSEAARVEQGLIRRTQDVIARYPSTSVLLVPVRDAHALHVEALVGTPVADATASATASAPADGRIGATENAALAQLARAERAAAREHVDVALTADPADARLIASIAAYASAQDVLITRAAQ
jgi:hypothetical protein